MKRLALSWVSAKCSSCDPQERNLLSDTCFFQDSVPFLHRTGLSMDLTYKWVVRNWNSSFGKIMVSKEKENVSKMITFLIYCLLLVVHDFIRLRQMSNILLAHMVIYLFIIIYLYMRVFSIAEGRGKYSYRCVCSSGTSREILEAQRTHGSTVQWVLLLCGPVLHHIVWGPFPLCPSFPELTASLWAADIPRCSLKQLF